MQVSFIIGIFLAFFLCFLILSKSHRGSSDNLLSFWLVFMGFQLLGYYSYTLGNWNEHPHLIGIVHPLPLVHGPFLYLTIVTKIDGERRIKGKDFLHFLPALLLYIYMLPFFIGVSGSEKILSNNQETLVESAFIRITRAIYIVSGLSYSAFIFYLLKRKMPLFENGVKNISSLFYRHIAFGLFSVFMLAAFLYLFQGIGIIPKRVNVNLFLYPLATLCLLSFCVFGIRNTNYFSKQTKGVEKAKNVGFDGEKINEYAKKLRVVMENKKPYIDPDFCSEMLSSVSGIPKRYLPKAIKKNGFNNFKDLTNYYRIENFKSKAGEPEYSSFDVFSIACEAGFRSKSTFYGNFYHFTGTNPSDFIQKKYNERQKTSKS